LGKRALWTSFFAGPGRLAAQANPACSPTEVVDNFVDKPASMVRKTAPQGQCNTLMIFWADKNRMKSMACMYFCGVPGFLAKICYLAPARRSLWSTAAQQVGEHRIHTRFRAHV
jgi:hypothetical protein